MLSLNDFRTDRKVDRETDKGRNKEVSYYERPRQKSILQQQDSKAGRRTETDIKTVRRKYLILRDLDRNPDSCGHGLLPDEPSGARQPEHPGAVNESMQVWRRCSSRLGQAGTLNLTSFFLFLITFILER